MGILAIPAHGRDADAPLRKNGRDESRKTFAFKSYVARPKRQVLP